MKKILNILLGCCGTGILSILTLNAQVIPIADVQGGVAASPYINQVVTVKGAVTGVYSAGYFIRDSDQPWSGIYIYDSAHKPLLGDTILLTAKVSEYYEWTELTTVSAYTVVSTGNPAPEPVQLTTGEIDESWESCLVSVTAAECTKTPATLGYGEWEVDDGTGPVVVNDLGYAFTPQLNVKYNITGNVSFSFGFLKIEPRNAADVEVSANIFINREVYPDTIRKTSLDISWGTNVEGSTEVMWGLTPDLELGSLVDKTASVLHSVKIEGLSPAGVYYVKPLSVSGNDTTYSNPLLFSTASESSGRIIVCFNRGSIPGKDSDAAGVYTSDMIDTMVSYVNLAQTRLDMAIYDFTNFAASSDDRNLALIQAVNSAHQRGVKVRFLSDGNLVNDALNALDPAIPLLKVKTGAIMHDKFMIIDKDNESNCWVITGSTNPTYNNLVMDYNNLVAIQDQSVARAYTLEFDEMYGSEGELPDTTKSQVGLNKKDNTPHHFLVGGKRMEIYFSPTDFTTNHMVKTLEKAVSRIDFSMMAFTEDLLGNALVRAESRGVKVRGVIDYVEYSGSEYSKLLSAGINVLDYKNPGGAGWPDAPTLHHKFAVVDAGTPEAAVITGSHNWTASAESRNDENTLIIHDPGIANLFKAESDRIYKWLWPLECLNDTVSLYDQTSSSIKVIENDIIDGNITVSIIRQPGNGSATAGEDNSISYILQSPDEAVIHDTIVYQVCYQDDPDYCEQAFVFITVNSSASSGFHEASRINVYPNPAYNEFHISAESPVVSVEVTDLAGKTLLTSSPFKTDFTISLAGFKGLYLLKMKTYTGAIVSRKIIMQ